jgi:hypothetical protein
VTEYMTNFTAEDMPGGKNVEMMKSSNDGSPEPVEPAANAVPDGTVAEINDWVGDNTDRAQQALDAEEKREKPRVSLLNSLNEKLGK